MKRRHWPRLRRRTTTAPLRGDSRSASSARLALDARARVDRGAGAAPGAHGQGWPMDGSRARYTRGVWAVMTGSGEDLRLIRSIWRIAGSRFNSNTGNGFAPTLRPRMPMFCRATSSTGAQSNSRMLPQRTSMAGRGRSGRSGCVEETARIHASMRCWIRAGCEKKTPNGSDVDTSYWWGMISGWKCCVRPPPGAGRMVDPGGSIRRSSLAHDAPALQCQTRPDHGSAPAPRPTPGEVR